MDTRHDYSDSWDFHFVKRHMISAGKISEYILHHPIYENSLFPVERCLVCLSVGHADQGDSNKQEHKADAIHILSDLGGRKFLKTKNIRTGAQRVPKMRILVRRSLFQRNGNHNPSHCIPYFEIPFWT